MRNTIATTETNEHIVERIQAGETDAIGILWTANKGLVAHIAKRYSVTLSDRGDCDIDDLMQAGFIGIHRAVEKYSPDKGAKFASYAVFYMRAEMRRALGALSKTSKRDAYIGAISLDAPLFDDQEDITLMDTLTAPEDDENILERDELCGAVRAAVSRMKHKTNRHTVESYHFEGINESQLAEAEGTSAKNISRRLYKGYLELSRDPELRKWAVDYEYINPHCRKGVKAFNSSFSSVVEDFILQAEEKATTKSALYEALGSLI